MNRFVDRISKAKVEASYQTKNVEKIQKFTIINNQLKFVGSERRK